MSTYSDNGLTLREKGWYSGINMENNLENTPPVSEAKVEPFGEMAKLRDEAPAIADETTMPNIVALENRDAKEAEEKAREDKVNAETAANLATVLKETNKGEISEIDGQMAKLKEEIGQLENQSQVIEGRINFQVMTRELSESGVGRDEQKAIDEIAKIDEKLEDAIYELEAEKAGKETPLIVKNQEVLMALSAKLNEQLADMEAGKKLVGDTELGPKGETVFKDVDAIDSLNRLSGSANAETVMQQAVGGEMAAGITQEMIAKQRDEMSASIKLIDQEYTFRNNVLGDEAEEKRVAVRAELEKDKQHRAEEIAKANQTIETLNGEKSAVDTQLEAKKHELEVLQIQKEHKEKGIEKYNAQIEGFNQKVTESNEKLGVLAERIKELSEQGATAVESLNNLEAAVDNRLANLENLTQVAYGEVDQYYSKQETEIRKTYSAEKKAAQAEYDREISAIEDSLIEKYPLAYYRNDNGELVPFPGILGEVARKPIVESVTPLVLKMGEKLTASIEDAKEKRDRAREENEQQKKVEYVQVEGLKKAAEEKLLNAKTSIEMVKAVAVEQFGTEPNTQKQKGFISKVGDFFGKMFGR